MDSPFEQKYAIKGLRGTGSNRYLVTLPEDLSGILSKKYKLEVCACSLQAFIPFPIPCPIEPDLKELHSPISNLPFLFLTHTLCSDR